MEAKLPIFKRIKELRKSRGWSQIELADKVKTDARMISHYETGKVIPSPEALIKIAEIFDVSTDYLLIENAQKKPLNQMVDNKLAEQFIEVNNLPDKDKEMIKYFLNTVIMSNKVMNLTEAHAG
jgi:transcriptional regulator with XRE-family HTH domain